MTANEFLELFRNAFEDIDSPEDIQLSTVYKELDDWSSLIGFSLISDVKTKCGKIITGKDIKQCDTVEDLYNLVSSK